MECVILIGSIQIVSCMYLGSWRLSGGEEHSEHSIVADVTSDNVVGTSQLASMTNLMMSEAEERCEKGVTSE